MAFLYLTEHGSNLRKRGERFIVEKDGKELLEVEARRVDAVIMLSSVQVTTQALCEMLSFGIEFAIITSNGKLLGQLTPPTPRNVGIRKAQYRKETDPGFALQQSRAIVAAKIENSSQVLLRHSWQESGCDPNVAAVIDRLEGLQLRAGEAESADTLLGIEGAAAAGYWSVFGQLLKAEGLSFAGRKKHPPPDPVNAVLSLGYVLLTNYVQSLLDGLGFDPFLGFFHEEHYGRPSLALDLLEPFRAPVVDRFAVRLFNLGTLKPESFDSDPEGGLRLRRDDLRTFFKHWESHLKRMDVRALLRGQAEQLADVFQDTQPVVKPWVWSA